MQIHELKKPKHLKSRLRRGRGGKRGTYSGRGMKGQKSRAGARIRPEIWDYIAKIPKLKGMDRKASNSPFGRGAKVPRPVVVVNTGVLNGIVKNGDVVTPQFLIEKKIVRKYKGRVPRVKLLATGELKKKITVGGLLYSASAKKAVENAGGTIKEISTSGTRRGQNSDATVGANK